MEEAEKVRIKKGRKGGATENQSPARERHDLATKFPTHRVGIESELKVWDGLETK